jgi:hypothetical protein
MFTKLVELFGTKSEKQKIEEYLADSISLEDVENRIKAIERGQAPWQINARSISQGWAL